jgi:ABC-2 type transport system ATP-binding protein
MIKVGNHSMIEVRNLSRFYGDFAAISDLTFSIQSNEVVGFLGLNGAGKSTSLKILACLLEASSGEVIIDGVNLATAAVSFRSKIGFLPEEPPLYKDMTVTEFLMYLGLLRGCTKQELLSALPGVIKKCQLTGHENQIIDELSLGYRKRVGIAQAIIHNPKLVILDEPISGLDPYQIVEMREVIKNLAKDATVLLSSHNLSEVTETCDRLLVLHDGKLIAKGTTQELSSMVTRQERNIEMTLHSNGNDLSKILTSLENVSTFQLESEGEVCNVNLNISGDTTKVVSELVTKGIGISRVLNSTSELEQTFLSLTQGGKQ